MQLAGVETGQVDPGRLDEIYDKPGEVDGARTADGSYPPLQPPRESGPTGDVPDTDIERRLSQLYVNDGLRGEDLMSKLLESGVDAERLQRFARENPSSFAGRAAAITFSLPWNWQSEYNRVNEEAAPMISLEEALRGRRSR
jgi:hypothetical protein